MKSNKTPLIDRTDQGHDGAECFCKISVLDENKQQRMTRNTGAAKP
jgi:hypothetical protein